MASPEEQVVFAPTVEGLFVRALGGELPAALFARGLSVELESFTENEVIYRITWK